jgi:hypothetical protein
MTMATGCENEMCDSLDLVANETGPESHSVLNRAGAVGSTSKRSVDARSEYSSVRLDAA